MKRRDFLFNGTLAGAAAIFTTGCIDGNQKKPTAVTNAATYDFELDEFTIADLQEKMANGSYTSEKITQLYLNRIEAIDKQGPRLNSVIEVNPDALTIARQMDAERKAGKIRGPLHGIPVLIKDNIDTADKMMTTAGSLALEGNIAAKDAFVVARLREAGAVLLGKTNLSEWANFRSSNSCSGWSSRGGQTKNPYILDHNPCGSSSGSGVAVAANLCAAAIGTETDGSITCPASVNGVVGIKPTVGLVSRSGIIPISSTQDTAGPLARTVTDAAILLGAITGIDEADSITRQSEGKALTDYTVFLQKDALKGKRLGVEKTPYQNQFLQRLQTEAIDFLRRLGAEVLEITYLSQLNALGEAELTVMEYEFKDGLNKYLQQANGKVKNLTELIAFNKANEDKVMPTFKQERLEASNKRAGLDSAEYKAAWQKSHLGAMRIIDGILQQHRLDALIGLTMGPACSIDVIYGDRWGDVFLTGPAAMSGYPHISVPCGRVYDLPVGLSFYGTAYTEGSLIGMAYAFEQAGQHRIKPGFKPSFLS